MRLCRDVRPSMHGASRRDVCCFLHSADIKTQSSQAGRERHCARRSSPDYGTSGTEKVIPVPSHYFLLVLLGGSVLCSRICPRNPADRPVGLRPPPQPPGVVRRHGHSACL